MKNEQLSFSSQPKFLNTAVFLLKFLRLWKLNLNVKNKTRKLEIRPVKTVQHLIFLHGVSIRPNCNISVSFLELLKHRKNEQVIHFHDVFPGFCFL